jgi:predicted cupin superfamily sugar epimerase
MTNPTASELVEDLNLLEHPEGGQLSKQLYTIADPVQGYFIETDRQLEVIPTPFAGEVHSVEIYHIT